MDFAVMALLRIAESRLMLAFRIGQPKLQSGKFFGAEFA